ncbi:thioredoxin domain-containing protein 5-like [Chrysoperla carnea]|uniref:thioredoxin domain-containing protein 5-like n=1 Tax=Chrysoperla carnea TaxID=189513 RepID=UPI001D07788B|nr:thioredoxin domain-containing protein 5-like [Chrysoperla carnea]
MSRYFKVCRFSQQRLSKRIPNFYALWKLAPTWKELGNNLEHQKTMRLSKGDYKVLKHISSFLELIGCCPTTLIFVENELNNYQCPQPQGNLRDQVLKMVSHSSCGDKRDSKQSTSGDTLTSSNFDKGIESNITFVKFYSPTCPNCQVFAPMWDELVLTFNNNSNIKFAKVDCTQEHNTKLCSKQEVPKISMYKNGKKIIDYRGQKTFDHLHTFVKQSLQLDNIREDTAKSESSTNFIKIIQHGVTIIKFYSPACPHCQNFAPVWDQLTSTYATKSKVKFSDVDCTKGELCEQQGVDGFPTLHVYKKGKKIDEYTEGWSYGKVHSFVKQYLD